MEKIFGIGDYMLEERTISCKGMTLYQAVHRICKEQLKGRIAYFKGRGDGTTEIIVKTLQWK